MLIASSECTRTLENKKMPTKMPTIDNIITYAKNLLIEHRLFSFMAYQSNTFRPYMF